MKIAVDLDGTLIDIQTREWLPGARDALQHLAAAHDVVIHTCRANWTEGLAEAKRILASAGFLLPIWTAAGKPQADLYIDNQAVHFDGDWTTILRFLAQAAPRPATLPETRQHTTAGRKDRLQHGRTWR